MKTGDTRTRIAAALKRLEECEESKYRTFDYDVQRDAARDELHMATMECGPLALEPLLTSVEEYIDVLNERRAGKKESDGVSLYGSAKDGVVAIAIEELSGVADDKAVKSLLRLAADDILPSEVAAALVGVLPQFGRVDACWKLVRTHGSWGAVTESATDALVGLGVRAVDSSIVALHDENVAVRLVAATVLGEVKAPEAVNALTEALRDPYRTGTDADPHYLVREAAARALEAIGNSDAKRAISEYALRRTDLQTLIRELKDGKDPLSRREAAQALGTLGNTRTVEPLTAGLQDQDSGVRVWSAWALGEIGDLRALDPLIAALKDESDWVRSNAVRALGALGDARAVGPLIDALEPRTDALEPRTVEDKYSNVCTAAAEMLGELEDTRAIAPLVVALQKEPNAMNRLAIERAVESIGGPEAKKALRKYRGR